MDHWFTGFFVMLIERRQAHIEISLGESQRDTAKTAIHIFGSISFFLKIFFVSYSIYVLIERTSHIGSNIENRYFLKCRRFTDSVCVRAVTILFFLVWRFSTF